MVDLNYGLLDTQFGQKLGAEFDPTVIAERQNKMMDLYNQRAIQNAAVAAAQQKQAVISSLPDKYKQLASLGVPIDKINETMRQDEAASAYQAAISPQVNVADGATTTIPRTKEEQDAALAAYVASGAPGSKSVLQLREFQDKAQAAKQAQLDRFEQQRAMAALLAANRPEQLVPVKQNDGTVIYIPRSQAAGKQVGTAASSDKPLTEFQAKDVGYGTRAQQAHDILNKVGVNYSPAKLNAATSVENVPGLGWAANAALGDTEQSVGQAQRNFINAVLRQESGAAIASSEFNNARKQYFPQPGDSDSVIAQKQANRERVIESFKIGAGTQGAKHFAPSVVTQSSAHPADINSLLQQYGTAR
jgi:hypothetical protein